MRNHKLRRKKPRRRMTRNPRESIRLELVTPSAVRVKISPRRTLSSRPRMRKEISAKVRRPTSSRGGLPTVKKKTISRTSSLREAFPRLLPRRPSP